MTRVAIYARYSSDRQNEGSVADQIAVCSRYAEGRGWEIARLFSDAAISGSAMANRPGLLDAIAAVERGEFDILLAEDEDRFARDLEHQAHVFNRIEGAGATLWTIATGKVELMHVAMKGFMAQDYIRNLSAKTKRGVRSNAEKGLATGGRTYGYLTAPGGHIEIVEPQAEIIRRIFVAYLAGDSPREIATALNAEGVPGPRGGLWNASTIGGERSRGNGILNTELYVGVKAWGRDEVRKDRQTGKRQHRYLPPEQWKRTPVPHLRIVDDDTWAKARQRKDRVASRPMVAQRRRGLFSGLLKCGECGGTYTVYTTGKLICATYREKGTCRNRRTPARAKVEEAVLQMLHEQMLSPAAVASYVRAYHHAAQARKADIRARRAPIEKRLAEVERTITRGVDAVMRGVATVAIEARLSELEREKTQLQAQIEAAADETPPVELHPKAAEVYANMVAELRATLADVTRGETAAERQLVDSVRGLVDRIVLRPLSQERGAPIDIEIEGTLARILNEQEGNVRLGALVAGASYVLTQPNVPVMFRTRL